MLQLLLACQSGQMDTAFCAACVWRLCCDACHMHVLLPSGGTFEHTLSLVARLRRGWQSPAIEKHTDRVIAAASCAGAKDSVALDAQYPAFREEMVCSLLTTLISHPRAAAASTLGPAQAEAQRSGQQDGALADAVQALSLQQAPPATPGAPVCSSGILNCPVRVLQSLWRRNRVSVALHQA